MTKKGRRIATPITCLIILINLAIPINIINYFAASFNTFNIFLTAFTSAILP